MRKTRRSVGFVCLVFVGVLSGCDPVETEDQSSPLVVGLGGLQRGSFWAYWDRGGDLGTAWRAGSFDESGWAFAHGPLGYGESYVTPISFGPNPSSKYITTYFRAQFLIEGDLDTIQAMTGELMYDDGVVVYLNGQEITRRAMPSGTVTASTLALGHEANNTYERLDWSAHLGKLVEGVNTVAVEVHQSSPASSDLVFDLSLTLQLAPDDQIARGSVWSYWDRGGDLGTAWTTRSFNDDAWASGAGPLGYGESYLRTVVGFGPSASSKYITTYFRREFNVPDPGAITGITGEVMYDDGFVVYINGTRIGRDSMPSGTVTASTLALGHEANNAYKVYDWSAQRSLLVPGINVIAVEVHQADPASSDVVFDLSLSLSTAPPPPPAELLYRVDRRSSWRYWDRGALGTSWRDPGFDDSTWATGAGPLGYGETYLATTVSYGTSATSKHITTYFRKKFLVENPPAVVVRLRGELMYDDGVVAYLNGHEISRIAMPTGTISATTLSTGHEAGNAYDAFDWFSAHTFLVPGQNVLAVEVHQASASSSDLVFDLALDVREVPTFNKYAGNPVIAATPPPEGEPDDEGRRDPSVLRLPDGSWVMYLVDDGPVFDEEIYRAVSADGVGWTIDPPDPVWRGFQPAVLYDGSLYRMWYALQFGDGTPTSVYLATSTDGVHWTAGAPGAVLQAGAAGGGWEFSIFNPTVIKDGSVYKVWYEAANLATGQYHLGYATSPDGVTWTRRSQPLPITNLTQLPTSLGDPFVIKERGDYKLWYSALSRSIEYATSPDGIQWTMWPVTAVSRTHQAGAWDELIRMGSVVRVGETLRLWYFGIAGNNGIQQIGYATHP